jgi:hydantoinase/carbamoylase family amidase
MAPPKVNGVRLHESIEELSKIGRQTGGGISRHSFTPADMQAREFVSDLMKDAGLIVQVDQFGNIIGRMKGVSDDLPTIMYGSHIDTVPNGGPLDGAYGVLSAIEVARTIHDQKISHKNPLEVIVFTDEEGFRFGGGLLGSLGLTGALMPEDAYKMKDDEGISFGKAMMDAGLDPKTLASLHPNPNEIAAYVELHIEQGPVLEREKVPIGVVSSIVGFAELQVELEGVASHAGTTPMSYRRDALVGASEVVLGVNKAARRRRGAVATVGFLSVSPNAANVIPGKTTFSIDFRNHRTEGLRQLQNELTRLTKRLARENHLKVRMERKSFTKPARMSRRIVKLIRSSAQSLSLAYKEMPSGAGHDCQNMARITDVGMIFVPSRGGISHAPTESTDPQHLEAGANVLLNTIVQLSNE